MLHRWFGKSKGIVLTPLALLLLVTIACGAAATATPAPAATKAPAPAVAPAAAPAAAPTPTKAPTAAPVAAPTATPAPAAGIVTSSTVRLKVGTTPPAEQLTMQYLGALSSGGFLQPMYEYLVWTDRFTAELKPEMLASQWEMAPDGKAWRFKLRKGIPFHSGTQFTARDVVFSWELMASKEARGTNSGRWRGLVKSKDAFEIVNDHEMVFNLARPEVELPFFLSDIQDFQIASKEYWDKVGADGYRKSPVGTGPFKFKEFKEGQYILYERVENHWRKTP